MGMTLAAAGCSIPETDRIAVLDAHDAGSFADDPRLIAITDFAAELCAAPIALVSLVEQDRQWFPARFGLAPTETARAVSFCAHAMLGEDVMIVPDATQDSRFAGNDLVTGAPHIRFYAGAPLVSADGVPLGSLCVIDDKPRPGLSDLERHGLSTLAQSVMALLSARRYEREHASATARAQSERDDHAQRFEVLADTMPQMVWSTTADGLHDYYNARWYDFTGVPRGSTDGEGWNGIFHPDDQERAWTRWRESLASGDPYEIEYRLRHRDGDYRWVLGRALPMYDGEGRIIRWFGTCTDIHEQKLALEQREVVSQELSHRIKNIFAVIGGLIGYTTRENPQFASIANDLRDRVMALGRAHDFVRPHSDQSRPLLHPSSLHGMLGELLAAYRETDGARIDIRGDDPAIDDRSATPLSLLFHELATNAAKYGALSAPEGRITIEVSQSEDAVLVDWTEQGGPAVAAEAPAGFGTRLIALTAERQLGGMVVRNWHSEGLRVAIRIPSSAMGRHRTR